MKKHFKLFAIALVALCVCFMFAACDIFDKLPEMDLPEPDNGGIIEVPDDNTPDTEVPDENEPDISEPNKEEEENGIFGKYFGTVSGRKEQVEIKKDGTFIAFEYEEIILTGTYEAVGENYVFYYMDGDRQSTKDVQIKDGVLNLGGIAPFVKRTEKYSENAAHGEYAGKDGDHGMLVELCENGICVWEEVNASDYPYVGSYTLNDELVVISVNGSVFTGAYMGDKIVIDGIELVKRI